MMIQAIAKRLRSPQGVDSVWDGSGDDIIGLHGPDGRFVRVSAGAESMFGQRPSDLLGLSLFDVVAVDDQQILLDALAKVGNLEGPGRARFEAQIQNGSTRRGRVEVSLCRTSPHQLRSIFRPIEHWLAREEKAVEANKSARELVEKQRDELANVSHEIRTPLNAVIGFADALQREQFGPIANDRYKDYARTIHESGVHLNSLITDLLDLSKAEAKEISIEKTPTDPAHLVAQCADMMKLQANAADLTVETIIADSPGTVLLDPKIVRQILLNLSSNALKFTEEGGVTLGLRRDGDWLVFTVIDTGVGMCADELAVIGQRFKQARREGVRGTTGTGIGLSLSKALARLHGGDLRLASAPGEGTTAMLRLPLERAKPSEGAPPKGTNNVTRFDSKRSRLG